MAFSYKDRLAAYVDPLELLTAFLYFFFRAIYSSALRLDFRTLFSLSALRSLGFADGFIYYNEDFKCFEDDTVVPELVALARGRVLELGPGAGSQVSRYKTRAIDHVYGVEPNTDMGPQLQAAVDKAGLGAKYTIVAAGVEDTEALLKQGIEEGSLDCILSIQVLCSVPKPKEIVAQLYKLLKPGGQLIVWEHIASADTADWLVQRMYTPIWSFALCGCSLDRQTDRLLVNAGKWEKVELGWDKSYPTLFPRVSGSLIKARN